MRYALKKVKQVIMNDKTTGKHKATMVEIKTASLSNGQETLWAEGANGVRLVGFDSGKTSNMSFESGVISTGVIEAQTGNATVSVSNGTAIKIRETYTLSGTTSFTLNHKAQGTVGSEIKFIYKADSTGEPSTTFAQAATASATEFTYTAATKLITLPTAGVSIGDTIIVDYYPKFSTYDVISNDADKFSFTGEVWVYGYWTDIYTKQDKYLCLYCPAGKVSGAFDFSFGDAVAVQKVDVECLSDYANGAQNMWKLYSYDMANIVDT